MGKTPESFETGSSSGTWEFQFHISSSREGIIFRTLGSSGVHPFSPVPGGCPEATLPLSGWRSFRKNSCCFQVPSPSPGSNNPAWTHPQSAGTSLCHVLTTLGKRDGQREGRENGLGASSLGGRLAAMTVRQAGGKAGRLVGDGAGAVHQAGGLRVDAGCATTPPVLDHVGMIGWVATGVLGQVVAPWELLGAEGAGEALFARVRPVVACQLVGARELLVAVEPVAGERALARVGALVGLQMRRLVIGFVAAREGAAMALGSRCDWPPTGTRTRCGGGAHSRGHARHPAGDRKRSGGGRRAADLERAGRVRGPGDFGCAGGRGRLWAQGGRGARAGAGGAGRSAQSFPRVLPEALPRAAAQVSQDACSQQVGRGAARARAGGGDLGKQGDRRGPRWPRTRQSGLRRRRRTHLRACGSARALGVLRAAVDHGTRGHGHQALGGEVVQTRHGSWHAGTAGPPASAVRALPAASERVLGSVRPAASEREARGPVRAASRPPLLPPPARSPPRLTRPWRTGARGGGGTRPGPQDTPRNARPADLSPC